MFSNTSDVHYLAYYFSYLFCSTDSQSNWTESQSTLLCLDIFYNPPIASLY